jgi:hypothetical protein
MRFWCKISVQDPTRTEPIDKSVNRASVVSGLHVTLYEDVVSLSRGFPPDTTSSIS